MSSRRCRRSCRRIPMRSSSSSARPIQPSSARRAKPTGTRCKARAAELGVDEHVVFHDQFLDTKTLTDFLTHRRRLRHALPRPRADRLGRAELCARCRQGDRLDAYRYAEEMLADGRGRLVPFRDATAIAAEIIDLLSNDVGAARHAQARLHLCPQHGVERCRRAVSRGSSARSRRERGVRPRIHPARTLQIDRPSNCRRRSLDHLHVLTDETGILQHARFDVPDRNHGYCTDDNARALIVALLGQHVVPDDDSLIRLAHRYLGFLQHAFNPDNRALPQLHELRPALAGRRSAARMPMVARSGRSARPSSTRRRQA